MSDEVSQPFLTLDVVGQLIRGMLPDFLWFMDQLDRNGGRIPWSSGAIELIESIQIRDYPLLYLDEAALSNVFVTVLFPSHRVADVNLAVGRAVLAGRTEVLSEIDHVLDQICPVFDIASMVSASDGAELGVESSTAADAPAMDAARRLWSGLLANTFQQISMVVMGRKLTDLVADAQAGSEKAFLQAIQIDPAILTEIPYFKSRHERARMEGDARFLRLIAHHTSLPPYNGTIRYKALWVTFFFLDRVWLLDTLKHADLLSFCVEVGATKGMVDPHDVGYLSKRVATFRRYQRMRLKSRHSP